MTGIGISSFDSYIGIDYSGAETPPASLMGLRVYFDVPGSVAKSTHAGLPWLRYIRLQVGDRVHFWPFDGWEIPAGRSVIVEVYPSLWSRSFAREARTADQHDAYSVAAWLRHADLDGSLVSFFDPYLSPPERTVAQVEGWILGIK